MSILIVDDTPDNVTLLRVILSNAGHTDLLAANTAEEAFCYLSLDRQEPLLTKVDIILMDIMMPGISGIEACEKIKKKEHLKNIPVIMITAKADLDSLGAAFKAGAMDYVTKPVRKVELLARLSSAMQLKREIDRRLKRERELENKNRDLEKALSEIKVLQGFLPICAHCKKIRNVEGKWEQLEAYIQEHSLATFSHSICHTCMKQHYPETKQ